MLTAASAVLVATFSQQRKIPISAVSIGQNGYVGSDSCRSCHPGEHASWLRTHHRKMTQAATASALSGAPLADGKRLRLELDGRSVELFARGEDQLWARLPDPEGAWVERASSAQRLAWFQAAPEVERQILLVTGSHRQQAFWLRGKREGELMAAPFVHWTTEGKLIARRDAFLRPPDAEERPVRWNSNCIQCHTVAGAPAHDEERDAFTSRVAELGIACEACHGPGAEHVRALHNPLDRYLAHLRGASSGTAQRVNPLHLDAARSSEVCGQCHAYFFPKDERDWWSNGFSRSYQAGEELARSRLLLTADTAFAEGAPMLDTSFDSLFYRDGSIRVGGREYNGLVLSPCFEHGEGERKLACTSCHSMHDSNPAGQLARPAEGNGACANCHQSQSRREHTHHEPDSAGSICYNCHMPRTTYALLGATRSHRISSPRFDSSVSDRPNACNLCHLERSESWAAARARSFWGEPTQAAEDELGEVAAGAKFALEGDAAVRAITAAALGRVETAGFDLALRCQLLAELAGDDYAAVRAVAGVATRALERSQGAGVCAKAKESAAAAQSPALSPSLRQRLLARRDQRPVTIAE